MSAFDYQALDASGREVSGVIQADSQRDARFHLREQGLVLLDVSEAGERPVQPRFGLSLGWSRKDLAILTRHLSTLLLSGIPLDMALQAAASQSEKHRVASIVLQVRSRIMEGQSLAASMSRHPRVFDDIYRAMVRAGEESGKLGQVLDHLAEYVEIRLHTQQRLAMSLLYPVVLMLVAFSVVGLLMVYVVPKIVRLFEYSNAELPLLTQWLIEASHFLSRGGGLVLLVIFAAFLFGSLHLLKNERRLLAWHQRCLRMPLIGNTIKTIESARFTSTLGVLVASGVPLATAMRIGSDVIRNRAMRTAAYKATGKLESGGSLSRALQASGVFPPMTVHMIASGEVSGELDAMLNKVADHQERELEMLNQSLLALFEPIMILVMGGVVLLIVLAVLIPIFDMNTLIR